MGSGNAVQMSFLEGRQQKIGAVEFLVQNNEESEENNKISPKRRDKSGAVLGVIERELGNATNALQEQKDVTIEEQRIEAEEASNKGLKTEVETKNLKVLGTESLEKILHSVEKQFNYAETKVKEAEAEAAEAAEKSPGFQGWRYRLQAMLRPPRRRPQRPMPKVEKERKDFEKSTSRKLLPTSQAEAEKGSVEDVFEAQAVAEAVATSRRPQQEATDEVVGGAIQINLPSTTITSTLNVPGNI